MTLTDLPELVELDKLLAEGRVREFEGPPFPVDPNARYAGFPPLVKDCVPVEPLQIPLLRRVIETPATAFGPARAEFQDSEPPLAVIVARATEYMYHVIGFEWAVSFDIVVGSSLFGTYYGNRWGWQLETNEF